MDPDDAEVAAALTAARATLESVSSRPDDPAKFKAISWLADGFRQLREDAAAERPRIVKRYRDRNKFALAPLAKQLGMSKTRVQQLYAEGGKDPEHV